MQSPVDIRIIKGELEDRIKLCYDLNIYLE